MTPIADRVSRTDRQRLLERLAELGHLDRLMRESGTLASPGEPEPLHTPRAPAAGQGSRPNTDKEIIP